MVSILGTDMDGFLGAIQGGVKDLLGSVSGTFSQQDSGGRPGFTGAPAADPFRDLNFGQGGDPYAGISFGSGQDWGASTAQQGLFNLAAGARGAVEAKARQERLTPTGATGSGIYEGSSGTGGTGGGGWTGPATAADNATLSAQQIDNVIRQTRGNSPMIGKGQLILDYANQRNVSVPLLLGIFLAESELGTTAGQGWNVAGVGGVGNFHGYASLDDAIKGAIDNLGSAQYQPLSLEAKIGYWFPGPQKWAASGLDASDGVNGTVRDYIGGKVVPMFAALGVPLNQAAAPTRQAQPPGAGVTPGGYSFPVVGYQGQIALHHGAESGASDIFAAAGTNVVAMRGGKVIDASYNSLGGNTVTIVGDDGLTYYYAHLRDAPLVAAGQQVQAGGALGFVGDTGNAKGTGAHLHLGIGRTILSGAGALGGSGTSWGDGPTQNAVGLLGWVLGGGR